jgi:hypothetical protein
MTKKVQLLDYVAGNIRSLVNAIEKCGYEVEWIKSPDDMRNAEVGDDIYFVLARHALFCNSPAHVSRVQSVLIAAIPVD